MGEWDQIAFGEAITKSKVGKANKIPSADIHLNGRFPVIDQGQSFIAGYTDDEERVVPETQLPLIIFGDHTRAVKYVDFPFVLGADGTVPIKPDEELFDPRFFYYALLDQDIPSRGYNRHFTLLKDKVLPRPPLPDQREIAGVLNRAEEAVMNQDRMVLLSTELRDAVLSRAIGDEIRDWERVRIASLGRLVTGTTPKTKVAVYYAPPEIPFIAPADIGARREILDSARRISKAGLGVSRPLPAKSVLCVCIGSSIGKVGMTTAAVSATNQQINAIICNDEYDPTFVYYLLLYLSNYWRNFATLGPMPLLSKGAFGEIEVPVPPDKQQQHAIAELLTAADRKLQSHIAQRGLANELFRSLLQSVMRGKIELTPELEDANA